MKNTKNYLFAAACVLLASSLTAQKQTPPAGGTPKDFKVPAKSTTKLPNGLRTTMVQYGEIPKVTISLIIKAGNAHENANQVWLVSAFLLNRSSDLGRPDGPTDEPGNQNHGF